MKKYDFAKYFPPIIIVIVYTTTEYPKLNNYYRSWIYFLIFLGITLFNFIRIHLTSKRELQLKLSYYIPTAAAAFRALICLIFTFMVGSNVYPITLPIFYLCYYILLCTFFDNSEYHSWHARSLRTALDFIFAISMFYTYSGSNNVSWLSFLIPIMVLARYYEIWEAYAASILASIFMIIISLLNNHISFNFLSILDNNFYTSIQFEPMKTYWQSIKTISVASFIFLLVVGIYHAETRLRFTYIFDLGRNLSYWIRAKGRKITIELLNYLCYSINSEAIIAVKISDSQSGATVLYSFQGHSFPFKSGSAYFEVELMKKYLSWREENLKENSNLAKSWKNYKKRFSRNYDPQYSKYRDSILPKLINDLEIDFHSTDFNIWEFHTRQDEASLQDFKDIFINNEITINTPHNDHIKATNIRDKSKMYSSFNFVTLVAADINEWTVYFVNNFPTNFRLVPRKFWDYGLEKIQLFLAIFIEQSSDASKRFNED